MNWLAKQIDWLSAWFKAHNWSTHSIAAFLAVAAGIIVADPQAKALVLSLFKNNPDLGTAIVTLAGIYVAYKTSHSPAGIMAESKAIQAQPDAPTAAEVDAATTK
jgi:hypothetical protein